MARTGNPNAPLRLFTPYDYGGVCDGVADDSQAVLDAVTAATAANGTVVFTAPCLITRAINVPSNVSCWYAGTGAVTTSGGGAWTGNTANTGGGASTSISNGGGSVTVNADGSVTVTNPAASGTAITANAPSGFAGTFLNLVVGGTSVFSVDSSGIINSSEIILTGDVYGRLVRTTLFDNPIAMGAATTALTIGAQTLVDGIPGHLLNLIVISDGALSTAYGDLSVGRAPFNGSSTGFFAGSAGGTLLAGNAASGFGGNVLDLQVAGIRAFAVTAAGLPLFVLTTTTSAPAAGGAGALPATPKGYATISVNGTNRQIAYY